MDTIAVFPFSTGPDCHLKLINKAPMISNIIISEIKIFFPLPISLSSENYFALPKYSPVLVSI